MILAKFSEKPKNLFSLLFWNFVFAFLPFNLFAGVLVLLFRLPINVNEEPTYGLPAFITVILLVPVVALGLAIMVWIYYSIGNFFLRLFIRLFK